MYNMLSGITRNGKKNTKQKSMQACIKTHHFEIKNAKIIWGGGHPLPRPHPFGAYGALIFAPTALKLNVTPPEKKF